MMEHVRQWLSSIVVVSLLLSVVQSLVPKGSLRRVASFLSGLVLLAVVLEPLPKLDLEGLELRGLQEETEKVRRQLEAEQETALKAGIAEQTEAYISDKAAALGLTVQARVETRTGEDGVPLPWSADMEGGYAEELAQWIEAELDIPRERQVWHGREGES